MDAGAHCLKAANKSLLQLNSALCEELDSVWVVGGGEGVPSPAISLVI